MVFCANLKDFNELNKLFPCHVGDVVYLRAACDFVITKYDRETNVFDCPFESDCEFDDCKSGNERLFQSTIRCIFNDGHGWYFTVDGIDLEFPIYQIGNTVFLTRTEAEQKLTVPDR